MEETVDSTMKKQMGIGRFIILTEGCLSARTPLKSSLFISVSVIRFGVKQRVNPTLVVLLNESCNVGKSVILLDDYKDFHSDSCPQRNTRPSYQ